MRVVARAEEMVEADLEQVGRRRVARDVAAELGRARSRLARTTIASAFQRISAARRCSIARSPGNGGCSSSAMRVDVRRDQRRRPVDAAARARARAARRAGSARAPGRARATSASSASRHSAVSAGSRSAPSRRAGWRRCGGRGRGRSWRRFCRVRWPAPACVVAGGDAAGQCDPENIVCAASTHRKLSCSQNVRRLPRSRTTSPGAFSSRYVPRS